MTKLGKSSFQINATFLRSFAFFSKERYILAFFCVLYKKNAAFLVFFYILYKRTLHSFTFFIKEHGIMCVLLHSLWKNMEFFAFFYILYKRTQCSLRSFTFFIKERKRTLRSFWFYKSYKNDNSCKKKNVKEWCVIF